MFIALLSTILGLEIFGIGLSVLAKELGIKHWYVGIIPVYGLKLVADTAGVFKVLSIPVKKVVGFYAELLIIPLLCMLYLHWAENNTLPKAYGYLKEILILPLIICIALIYLSVIMASLRIYKRYGVQKKVLYFFATLLIVPIPALFYNIRKNEAVPLSEMF